jgi:hypothetical protein
MKKTRGLIESKLKELLNSASEEIRKDFYIWKRDSCTDFWHEEIDYLQNCLWEIDEAEKALYQAEAIETVRSLFK